MTLYIFTLTPAREDSSRNQSSFQVTRGSSCHRRAAFGGNGSLDPERSAETRERASARIKPRSSKSKESTAGSGWGWRLRRTSWKDRLRVLRRPRKEDSSLGRFPAWCADRRSVKETLSWQTAVHPRSAARAERSRFHQWCG